jgi:hypothetical protein
MLFFSRPNKSIIFCAIAAGLLLSSGAANAVTYNAVTEFSVTNGNPNGVWTYIDNGNAIPNAHTGGGQAGLINYWSNDAGVPNNVNVGRTTGGPDNFGNSPRFDSTYLTIDPESHIAGVRFTAETDGIYDIVGQFLPADTASRTHAVQITDDGVSIFDGTVGLSQSAAFNLPGVNLSAGEMIEFLVFAFPNTIGQNCYFCELSTGLQATISDASEVPSVPLPASLPLLLSGMAGAGFLLRRRKNRAERAH